MRSVSRNPLARHRASQVSSPFHDAASRLPIGQPVIAGPSDGSSSPTARRWLARVRQHGSHTSALEALLRQADELDRIEQMLRERGLSLAALVNEARR